MSEFFRRFTPCGFPLRTVVASLLMCGSLAGCQITDPGPVRSHDPAASQFSQKSPEGRGQKFAVNRCADCHAVGYGETSPLAAAPAFSAIANERDLSKSSLTQWLHNHKNYPDEMYFEVPEEHIEDLVAYMITLRRSQ